MNIFLKEITNWNIIEIELVNNEELSKIYKNKVQSVFVTTDDPRFNKLSKSYSFLKNQGVNSLLFK